MRRWLENIEYHPSYCRKSRCRTCFLRFVFYKKFWFSIPFRRIFRGIFRGVLFVLKMPYRFIRKIMRLLGSDVKLMRKGVDAKEVKALKFALMEAETQVAYWMGATRPESESEERYTKLCSIPLDKRTEEERNMIRKLSRLIMSQVDWCPNCLE